MTRQQKYPDTETFHWHNQNPKGRITTDCVIRAISLATMKPYNDVVRELAEWQCVTGYDMSEATCYGRYLESLGWMKHKQPRKADNTKYTGEEFCETFGADWDKARVVANIGGNHTVAIINGKVNDTWNSTDGCIGNYWTKNPLR